MVLVMTLNPQYDTIGRTFVQQYYTNFDDPAQRASVANFYNEEKSLMTFEGQQLFGRTKIMEKIQSLAFQKIAHIITAVDPQPMFDGGILICVLGQLKTDEDPPHTFNQTFVLKPLGDAFYVEHDVFSWKTECGLDKKIIYHGLLRVTDDSSAIHLHSYQ